MGVPVGVPPRVRVGLVSYRTPGELARCLSSLPGACAGLDADVVVVDNASGDDSVAVAGSFAGVTVVASPTNDGYARAMNRALAGSDADVLIAVNPDTELPPRSLASMVETLLAEPRLGLVSPRLVNADGSVQQNVHRFPSVRLALVMGLVPPPLRRGRVGRVWWLEGYADLDRRADVDWTVGAVHVLRRQALGGEPPYREASFMYAEDMDLCWRLRRDGWRVVYDPAVSVTHVGNVAGAEAFGSAREARWLDATYDWYVERRGPAAARAWAAANAAGLSAKWCALLVAGRPAHRASVGGLLRFHALRVVDPRGDQHSRRAPAHRPRSTASA